MIIEYSDIYYNDIIILGKEICDNYKLSLSSVSHCYIYIENNKVIGFIIADIFDDRAEIIDIAVDLLYRNRKIGNKLLNYIIDLCINKKCYNITLEVSINNKPAIKLYEKNYFIVVSTRKNYYLNGKVDAYLMERKL